MRRAGSMFIINLIWIDFKTAQRNFPTDCYVKRAHTDRPTVQWKTGKITIFTNRIEVEQSYAFASSTAAASFWQPQRNGGRSRTCTNKCIYILSDIRHSLSHYYYFFASLNATIQHQRQRDKYFTLVVIHKPPCAASKFIIFVAVCTCLRAISRKQNAPQRCTTEEFASFLFYCFDDTSFTCSQKSRMRSK